MTNPCEIAESLVTVTSSAPAVDLVLVAVGAANASSAVLAGVAIPLLTDSVRVGSTAFPSSYALAVSSVVLGSTLLGSVVSEGTLTSRVKATSAAVQYLEVLASSSAEATSSVPFSDAPSLLVSELIATSSVPVVSTNGNVEATSSARALSSALVSKSATLLSSIDATSSVTAIRSAYELAADIIDVLSGAAPSGATSPAIAASSANVTSRVISNAVLSLVAMSGIIEANSDALFRNPDALAWVMNTETTAMSWYDSFGFDSLASWGGKTYGAAPDGIYELTGNTDDGVLISASVKSGFVDFGAPQTKRLDNMYFGYTSDGQIQVTTEVLDSGFSPASYVLEQRPAGAPRNSRVTPGKGLWGRYWRLAISNVSGADFEVADATVDVAVSSRRI